MVKWIEKCEKIQIIYIFKNTISQNINQNIHSLFGKYCHASEIQVYHLIEFSKERPMWDSFL